MTLRKRRSLENELRLEQAGLSGGKAMANASAAKTASESIHKFE